MLELEIDTNPPTGSAFTTSYITFPVTAPLTTQTLASSFALKLHALLCRSYVKGRDWYDFVWYVARRVSPTLELLRNALHQQGPWAGQSFAVTTDWVQKNMEAAIRRIDWDVARNDVQRFLPLREQDGLRLWVRISSSTTLPVCVNLKTTVETTKYTKWHANNNAGAFTRRVNTYGIVSWFVFRLLRVFRGLKRRF